MSFLDRSFFGHWHCTFANVGILRCQERIWWLCRLENYTWSSETHYGDFNLEEDEPESFPYLHYYRTPICAFSLYYPFSLVPWYHRKKRSSEHFDSRLFAPATLGSSPLLCSLDLSAGIPLTKETSPAWRLSLRNRTVVATCLWSECAISSNACVRACVWREAASNDN